MGKQTIKADKVVKTIKLTPSVIEKLDIVTDELGVNVHAYLCHVVGAAVQKDYLAFHAKLVAEQQADRMVEIYESALNSHIAEEEAH